MKRLAVLIILSTPAIAAANPALPTGDVPGSADSPILKRFDGSIILSYDNKRLDELTLPLSKLEYVVPSKRNHDNNTMVEPKQKKTVEGELTHLLYVIPPKHSSFEVFRNYQDDIKAQNGTILYECKAPDCGGDENRNVLGGGGNMGLPDYLRSSDKVTAPYPSLARCAHGVSLSDLRYLVAELPGAGAHISILTANMPNAGDECAPLQGRALAVVDIIQSRRRESKMVTVPPAAEMAQALSSSGKIALYGVYFDSNKTDVKPSSEETLTQIGKLLKDNPKLNLLVVGHTDNAGGLSSNMDLSKKRAAAVVVALVARFGVKRTRLTPVGVSFAAPIGSNKTEDGRAKNRRVELVEN
jgi:outer membrane protein OmpA-like peptidoglycan-associated protein